MTLLPSDTAAAPLPSPGALTEWLHEHDPETRRATVRSIHTASETAGFSNRTWILRLSEGADLVVRAGPVDPDRGYFPRPSVDRQYRIQTGIAAETTLPVPPCRFLDTASPLFGGDVFVMDRIAGRVPGDQPIYTLEGFVAEAPPLARAVLWEDTVATLAAVGAHRPGDLLAELRHPGRPAHAELQAWQDHLDWALAQWPTADRRHHDAERIHEWLATHAPDTAGDRLRWGDARLANVIFRDDLTVAALLDWELAGMGDPESDLAYFLLMARLAEAGMGHAPSARPRLTGFADARETIRLYEQAAGVAVADTLGWYWVLSVFKIIAMLQRMNQLLASAGRISYQAALRRRAVPHLVAWADAVMAGGEVGEV